MGDLLGILITKVEEIAIALQKSKLILFTLSVVMISILDSSIVRLFALQFIDEYQIIVLAFFSIVVIICISLILYLNEIKKALKTQNSGFKSGNLFIRFFQITQYVLVALSGLSLIIVLAYDSYRYVFLYPIILIVHLESLAVFFWIVTKFIKWVLVNKSKFLISYIVSLTICTGFIFISLINYVYNFDKLMGIVKYIPYYNLVYTISISLSYSYFVNTNFFLSFMTFISMWVTTALLLHQYLNNTNRKYFWFLVSFPLAYFIIQFMFIELDYLSSIILVNPIDNLIAYEFLFLFSYPLVGVLFGFAMLFISRNISNSIVKNNLRMLSIGFMLLFCSFQPNSLLYLPFPPFGIGIVLMGVGAFLIVISLYQTVYILSKNMAIYRELVNSLGEKNFLTYLSEGKRVSELTEMVQDINQTVNISKFNLPPSDTEDLSGQEISDIMEFIRDELKK